jgi:hypothetical protein
MTKLDSQFAKMREMPLPAGLDAIEGEVFAGIAMRQKAAEARRGLVLAGFVSLVAGLSVSLMSVNEARAEPMFGIPAAAPSRLLGL